jgi:hypothetical protein
MKVFRGKMLAYADKAVEKEELSLPEGMSVQRWRNLRNRVGRVKWNVHIRERYEHGKGVLIYLSRYIRGGAISNKRIESVKENRITFRHRAGEEKKQSRMTLTEEDFIQRYLLHIPEPHTKMVRSYGLYATAAKEELNLCRAIFGQEAPREVAGPDWQEYCEARGDEHPELCPVCGQRLVRTMEIPPMRHYRQPANKEAIPKAA